MNLEFANTVLRILINPSDAAEVRYCFGFYCISYLIVHIFWDFWIHRSAEIFPVRFRDYVESAFQAGTFASGILLGLSAFHTQVATVLLESHLVLLLPGIVCVLHSLSHIKPEPIRRNS